MASSVGCYAHPDRAPTTHCVTCRRPLCVGCRILDDGSFYCPEHAGRAPATAPAAEPAPAYAGPATSAVRVDEPRPPGTAFHLAGVLFTVLGALGLLLAALLVAGIAGLDALGYTGLAYLALVPTVMLALLSALQVLVGPGVRRGDRRALRHAAYVLGAEAVTCLILIVVGDGIGLGVLGLGEGSVLAILLFVGWTGAR